MQNHYARLSLPIWKSSYQDPAVRQGQEALIDAADKALNVMLMRPIIPDYSRLSNMLQQHLQQVLQGQETPEAGMQALTQSASRLR